MLGRNPKALFQVADEDLPDPGAVIPTGEQEPRVRFKGWLPNGSWGVVSSDPDDTTDKTGLMREYGRTRTTEPVRLAAWDWDGALPLKTGGWLAKQDLELREINGRGQVVWKAALPRHQQGVRETGWCCFDRVANKNTLLGFREDPHEGLTFGVRGAYAPVWKSRVVEVNAAGRAVMDFTTEDKIMGVHSCFVLIRFGFDSFQPEGLDLRSADSLVQRLDCADPRTRALAAFTLHCLSERQDTEKVVARLGEQIGQPEWLTAEHIRNLLIEDMPDKGVPALSKALKHTDPRVRVRAVESLHRYLNGKRSPELKGPILDCLSDPDPRVVAAALRVWPFDEYQQSMARLKVLLKAHSQPGGDPDVFYETVLKLADLDPRLADLEPSVIAALKGADIRFKRKAAGLVYRMRRIDDWPPEVRKAVVRCLLAQKDADLRAELLCCLENMTAPPKEVMDEVIKILGQPAMFGLNDTTKLAAVAFCHRAQSETAAAIPALILVLASPRESSEMRGEVADCLREKWPKDPRVRRALQKASNDPD